MKGYYSLVQYCPDPFREEAVNVGLVLLCPEDDLLEVEMTSNHDRARRFFEIRGQSLANLRDLEQSLAERIVFNKAELMNTEALAKFAKSRSNRLTMTSPVFVLVDDFGSTFGKLFSELVHDRQPRIVTRSDLRTRLSKLFQKYVFENKAEKNVELNVPVLDKPWAIDYKYVNGVTNFVRLQGISSPRAMTEATKSILDWDLLKKHNFVDPQTTKLIVPMPVAVDTEQEKLRSTLSELYGNYGAETVFEENFAQYEHKVQHDFAYAG